jgi:hypothetical protein
MTIRYWLFHASSFTLFTFSCCKLFAKAIHFYYSFGVNVYSLFQANIANARATKVPMLYIWANILWDWVKLTALILEEFPKDRSLPELGGTDSGCWTWYFSCISLGSLQRSKHSASASTRSHVLCDNKLHFSGWYTVHNVILSWQWGSEAVRHCCGWFVVIGLVTPLVIAVWRLHIRPMHTGSLFELCTVSSVLVVFILTLVWI